jgi:integrase
MGSIFHKKFTREIPSSAKLVEKDGKTVAQWTGNGGKKLKADVVTLADGRRAVRVESETYFAKYRNNDDEVVTVSTDCRDRSLAEQFLSQLERDAERVKSRVADSSELLVAKRAEEPIENHIKVFLATFRGSEAHRKSTRQNLNALIRWIGWKTLSDLTRNSLEHWLATEVKDGRSARSMDAHQTSIVSFCNWCVDNGRLKYNPFARIKKANEKADPRRPRRAFTEVEFSELVEAARRAPARPPGKTGKTLRPAERLSGPERAEVYTVLVGTGLRVGELAQLKIDDLDLEARKPGFNVRADVDKTGRAAWLPLHPGLVDLLKQLVKGRKGSERVFDIPSALIQRFDADLKRAGIPKMDERGRTLDIHSLRVTFNTWLAKAGVSPRLNQELMRHQDLKMTTKVYTDVSLFDLAGALDSLSMLHQIMHQTGVLPCPSSPLASAPDLESVAS